MARHLLIAGCVCAALGVALLVLSWESGLVPLWLGPAPDAGILAHCLALAALVRRPTRRRWTLFAVVSVVGMAATVAFSRMAAPVYVLLWWSAVIIAVRSYLLRSGQTGLFAPIGQGGGPSQTPEPDRAEGGGQA